jgi:hypothetical protein
VKLADRDFYAGTRIAATTCAVAATDGRGIHPPRTNESTVGQERVRKCTQPCAERLLARRPASVQSSGLETKIPPEENPFLDLQRQRRRHRLWGFIQTLATLIVVPRSYTSRWGKAWRAELGRQNAGYLVGLSAWYPLRESVTAAGLIARYVPHLAQR